MSKKGLLIVFSGPSGSGKDTVLERLINRDDNIVRSISATTRSSREGEVDGKDYFFVSEKDFCNAISEEKLLEYTKYCGNYYGTLREFVEELQDKGKDVVLKIEVDGAKQIKEKCPDAMSIFVLPPSMSTLQDRLLKRGTESKESLEKRLNRAHEEIKSSFSYDYVVVNDDVDKCAEDVHTIISAEKLKTIRMKNIISEVLDYAENFD